MERCYVRDFVTGRRSRTTVFRVRRGMGGNDNYVFRRLYSDARNGTAIVYVHIIV